MLALEVLLSDPVIPVVVESSEEFSHVWLTPHGMILELFHHPAQPGTPGLPVAEDPDYALGLDATGFRTVQPRPKPREFRIFVRRLPASLFELPVGCILFGPLPFLGRRGPNTRDTGSQIKERPHAPRHDSQLLLEYRHLKSPRLLLALHLSTKGQE